LNGAKMKPSGAPSEQVARQLELLEEHVDAAISLVGRLRHENEELRARLAESDKVRRQALERLDSLLDRIDALL
jgi:hypothetical protein